MVVILRLKLRKLGKVLKTNDCFLEEFANCRGFQVLVFGLKINLKTLRGGITIVFY